ncbi:MerR family transcriptional regulator [Paenibacillus sp. GCM10027627]|uniref:MerR family transcriptional regulator n=1 Tax=unclassified Paenibacillus TaxID=185978 RepID=UPI00363E3EA9
MYTIGQMSKKTNISIRTLRYYDERGLLKPAKISDSGYRYYSNEEVGLLRHITALKELGFTLSSIKELIASGDSTKEGKWQSFLNVELSAIANERNRLDEMERLLLNAKYALEMNGDIEPEHIFLFIRAIQSQPGVRSSFSAELFTEREIAILKKLPDLSSDDPRTMKWATLIRTAKAQMNHSPSEEEQIELGRQFAEVAWEWFEGDEELIAKYWTLIRPEAGGESKVFALDEEVMAYVDLIVDRYLRQTEEEKSGGI